MHESPVMGVKELDTITHAQSGADSMGDNGDTQFLWNGFVTGIDSTLVIIRDSKLGRSGPERPS